MSGEQFAFEFDTHLGSLDRCGRAAPEATFRGEQVVFHCLTSLLEREAGTNVSRSSAGDRLAGGLISCDAAQRGTKFGHIGFEPPVLTIHRDLGRRLVRHLNQRRRDEEAVGFGHEIVIARYARADGR